MKLELIVKLDFKATHVLEENEKVHEHHWKVDVTLSGENKMGRIISLPKAQGIFRRVLSKIENTHLNHNPLLDNSSREIPTCENLVCYLYKEFNKALDIETPENPSLKIIGVEVAVDEEDGRQLGAARLSIP